MYAYTGLYMDMKEERKNKLAAMSSLPRRMKEHEKVSLPNDCIYLSIILFIYIYIYIHE